MKYLAIIALFFFLAPKTSFSQYCSVTVTPDDTTICLGDSVLLVAFSNLVNSGQSFDFNSATLPAGWSTSGGTAFSSPCGANPTGTPYYWASTAGSGTPEIITANFDVFCGGFIIFDFVYSVQSDPSPCEGPDQDNEGISLEYSIDNGITWVPITYYQPDGQILPVASGSTTSNVAPGQSTPFTSWTTQVVPIPQGAMGTSTKFRWTQEFSSGSAFDNWGLDNIVINSTGTPCGSTTVVNWSDGTMDQDSIWVYPTGDTMLIAYVYDTLGNYQCEAPGVNIQVFADQMTYNLVDTVISMCPDTEPSVQVQNIANSVPPYSVNWSVPGTTNPINLPTSGIPHDTITYYVDITDACGYIRYDSVVLVVNQTLKFDTIIAGPSSCTPTGYVSAMVSGQTTTPAQGLLYNWSGPGPNSPNNWNASVWTNLSAGWYYISVIDAVCQIEDSIEITLDNPPIADFSASQTSGCNPLTTTFTNNSQNSNTFEWTFGNGNAATVTNLDNQTETYTSSANVMLVAFQTPTCSDTAYVQIAVANCGCTDPTATNYDPNATVDDGSCTPPIPPLPTVEVPNVFTPNGDNVNDIFEMTVTNYSNIELTILNRWGNVVYSNSTNFPGNPGWNGKMRNGSKADDGTYFYNYVITGIDGASTLEGHGFLQLINK